MSKKVLSLLLAAVIVFSVFSAVLPVAAAEDTMKTLLYLTKKFPHKKYWNHVGSKENDPDSVTSLPCPTHKDISWDSEDMTCNSFENAIQCMGFAYKIAYEITGSSPRTWSKREKLSPKKLCVGDVIRYRNGSHSLVVTGIKNGEISFVDANWYPGCQIRWGRMKLSDMPGFSYVLHESGNTRKNADLDFHKATVERGDKEEEQLIEETESWKMNDEGSLNVRVGASTKKSIIGQIPPEATFSVSEKKSAKDHLWGLVTYGSLEGWAVLDYSTYLSGGNNAPVVFEPAAVFAAGESISVSWKKTQGANTYTVQVLSSKGKRLAQVKTSAVSARFTVKTPDKVNVTVTAGNTFTPSWKLKGEAVTFTVLDKNDIKLTSLRLGKSETVIPKGGSEKLSFSVAPSNAGNKKLLLQSADEKIAAIDENGVITAKGFGKTTVTASSLDSSNLSAVCSVTVVPQKSEKLCQSPKKTKQTSVTVSWKKVSGASGYRLYRYNKTKKTYALICETKSTSYTMKNLKAGTDKYFAVRPFALVDGLRLFGAMSEPVLICTRPESPVVSGSLKKKKAIFKWKKVSGATGYEVYVKKNGKYVLQKKLSASKTVFEKRLNPNEKCVLRVRTVIKADTAVLCSAYSKTTSVRR